MKETNVIATTITKQNTHIMKNLILPAVLLYLGIFSLNAQNDSELNKEYPEARKEVKKALDDIEMYIRENRMDELIAMHAYGPKFTEFEMGGKRQGSKENEEFERSFLGSITEVEKWDWEDLKINVYGGDVANVTFHSNFKFKMNEDEGELRAQGTLLFIKTSDGWKITHEHLSPMSTE